jgi:hypothetical protein
MSPFHIWAETRKRYQRNVLEGFGAGVVPELTEVQLEVVRIVGALFTLTDAIEKRVASATAHADKGFWLIHTEKALFKARESCSPL